jgi:hypothetical protein
MARRLSLRARNEVRMAIGTPKGAGTASARLALAAVAPGCIQVEKNGIGVSVGLRGCIESPDGFLPFLTLAR